MNYQQQEQQYYNNYNTAPNIPINRYEIEKKSNNNLYIGLLVFCFFAMLYYLSVSLPKKKAEEKAEADAAVAAEKKKKEEAEAAAKKDTPGTQGSAIIPPAVPPRRFPAPPKGAVEFGGMFGYGTPKNYDNPLTDGLNCPSKFTATKILEYSGIDFPLYYCSRTINNPDTWVPTEGSAEFGGMFTNDKRYVNPLTSNATCPDNFDEVQIFGTGSGNSGGTDVALNFCYKAIEDPDKWVPDENSLVLGGMMGYTLYKNPVTSNYTCPSKFTENVAYGKVNIDNSIAYCAVKYDDL